MFYTANPKEIKKGKLTDIYFVRTMEVLKAKKIDKDGEPSGTMSHALILIMGDTVNATKAFDEVVHPRVKRVSLIDTLNDDKIEAIRVAEALGRKLPPQTTGHKRVCSWTTSSFRSLETASRFIRIDPVRG